MAPAATSVRSSDLSMKTMTDWRGDANIAGKWTGQLAQSATAGGRKLAEAVLRPGVAEQRRVPAARAALGHRGRNGTSSHQGPRQSPR